LVSDLLPFFETRTHDLVNLVNDLVAYESPSRDKALVDVLGAHIHRLLEALGAHVTVMPRERAGDIRLAKWNASAQGPPILTLVHTDTVWPEGTLGDAVPIKLEDGRLHGPGALDMKGGIAIFMEAIRGLRDRDEFPDRPIWLLLTTDEELGSPASIDIIIETAKQCGLCLVPEPAAENEGIKTSRKGVAQYWLTAKGVASHAGSAPEAGVNAIIELAHQALAVQKLNQLRDGTSVSVTTISGGTAGNVIPAEATAHVDVRFFHSEEADRVDAAIKGLQPITLGAGFEVRGGINRYPLERNAQMIETFQQAKALAESIDLPLSEAAVGGGSDGNLTASAGVPTLDGLGGHGDGMHALHEHVLVRSLYRRAALMAAILRDWQFA
jgi:glutamate carboxypeptidase